MNCGEIGHVFNDYPKPKPRLLESVVDIAVSTPRTPFSELPSIIYESCVINLNSDYGNDSTMHHLNDALVIRRKIVKNSSVGSAIVRTLKASIDTTFSPCLRAVGKEVPHSRKNVECRVKRNTKRKLLSRSKRPPTNGWRLNDKEFDELHRIYKFTMEGCCDSLGSNGHRGLHFYSKENSLLDHNNVSGQSVYCNPPWSLHCN